MSTGAKLQHCPTSLLPCLGRLVAVGCALLGYFIGCGGATDTTAEPPQPAVDAGHDAVGADAPKDGAPSCEPLSCASLGAQCGTTPDGCGGVVDCGSCGPDIICGGAGPNRCGSTPCTATTCAATANACGVMSDGCSKTIDCGGCKAPRTCGGGGVPNRCGCPEPTCAALGATCGNPSDSCGATVSCGACTAPDTCGGGGQTYTCGCTPKSCGNHCGTIDDGCGGTLSCSCGGGKTCSGGTCCTPNCSGASCGDSDGCGGDCDGDCSWSNFCGSDHQCHCGPSPDFKLVGGQCKASCGQFIDHHVWNNVQNGCCPTPCVSANGSAQGETWDCNYCCENFAGVNACQ